jgi:hypothetical protein
MSKIFSPVESKIETAIDKMEPSSVPTGVPTLLNSTSLEPTAVNWNYLANAYYSNTSWGDILGIFWYVGPVSLLQ